MDNDSMKELLKISYKKLKSYIYYDKTQLLMRDKIVYWESHNNVDQVLASLANAICEGKYKDVFDRIISSITYAAFPKKLLVSAENNDDTATFVTNLNKEPVKIDELQYFINMDVEGFILGVAWILKVGYLLDERIYEHSYGNRLRKKLISEDDGEPTYSPYLFEPYFQQYETWRDKALNVAKESLRKKQDVVILTLDFKRFFYQVDVKPNNLMKTIRSVLKEASGDSNFEKSGIEYILTEFVGAVIEKYSQELKQDYPDIDDRSVLPIGFPPSNILSNFCLKKFDGAMVDGWNPLYYGRYVDDIIIVDKVEKNSWVHSQADEGCLTADKLIDHFLLSFDAWRRTNKKKKNNSIKKGLLIKKEQDNNTETIYYVSPEFDEFPGSDIIVQNSKVKIFYFDPNQTDALLDCFQTKLQENKSEFRFLPEDESIFRWDDYSEIYSLIEKEGPNKLRGVDGISIDKFNLSKFLGKYMRISGLVDDSKEKRFERDIPKIFDANTAVENYQAWEKVFSILAMNEKYDAILSFAKSIIQAIDLIQRGNGDNEDKEASQNIRKSLIGVLQSAVNKSLSVVWGKDVKELVKKLCEIIPSIGTVLYDEEYVLYMRKSYCNTRMCDKYSIVLPIDCFIKNGAVLLSDDSRINLTKAVDINNYNEVVWNYREGRGKNYLYYPYLISVSDLTYYNVIRNMKEQAPISTTEGFHELLDLYVNINFNANKDYKVSAPLECAEFNKDHSGNLVIKVGDKNYQKIKVAVANSNLFNHDFERVLKDDPNRSFERYQTVTRVVNEALRCHADMLIMPECFLPFEWLPILARTCAKNQMAVVTGIEHVKTKAQNGQDVVYNLTAVILPYQDDTFRFSYIHFHSKTYFSPNEKEAIISYRCIPGESKKKTYELFCWNDFWFPVYCCYELASIRDRALFQSYADAVVAVEWNKDTKYYSNIVESLSRDLHCYCIQVNTAKYGDSRITLPAKSEEKDLLKVKGGMNSTVLIDTLDIKELREFQMKGNILQAKSKSTLKLTPPDFDYDIVHSKIDHKLWEQLK